VGRAAWAVERRAHRATNQRIRARAVVVSGRRIVVTGLGVVAATVLAHARDVGGIWSVVVGAYDGAAVNGVVARPRRLDVLGAGAFRLGCAGPGRRRRLCVGGRRGAAAGSRLYDTRRSNGGQRAAQRWGEWGAAGAESRRGRPRAACRSHEAAMGYAGGPHELLETQSRRQISLPCGCYGLGAVAAAFVRRREKRDGSNTRGHRARGPRAASRAAAPSRRQMPSPSPLCLANHCRGRAPSS